MDDFVYRLGKRAKRAVFSISDPMSFAETVFMEFTTEERMLVWARIQAGQFPVVPEGTDSELRKAVGRFLEDAAYRDQIQLCLLDCAAKHKARVLKKEDMEWFQKRKKM